MDYENQKCNKGIWDQTIPGIIFSPDGSSNYSSIFENMEKQFPRGEEGLKEFNNFINNQKKIKIIY